MSWQLSMSGHVETRDDEEQLVDDLVEFMETQGDAVATASLSTTHLGTVDLVARMNMPAEPASAPEEADEE